ncbi:MAG: efflux RND transporter periplasmic adaptor subunit [Deltaproteobacteria bacterium]|nr:efflux RND transporter periplasmic adaptor subunit [Deltaproteobacteria bacterium]
MSALRFVRKSLRILFPVVLIALMVLWLSGAFRKDVIAGGKIEAKERSAEGISSVEVSLTRLPVTMEAVGAVQARCRIAISPKVSAHIVAIPVRAGQQVKKGDLLVRCDERDLKARLMQAREVIRRAEAERDLAASDHRRDRGLFEKAVIPCAEFDKTDARFKAAAADVERSKEAVLEAEVMLGYTEIRSPADATVVDRFAEAGDLAMPGKTLLTLYARDELWLEVDVRENDAGRLRIGEHYTVEIDARGERMLGSLVEIVPSADSASRTVAVRIGLPESKNLYPGMFGRLLIPAGEAEYLVIPRNALIYAGQLAMVDVVSAGVLRRRAVQPGRKFGERVEILSGLAPGERVVLREGKGVGP